MDDKNLKSISNLAEEFDVTKQTIYNHLNKLNRQNDIIKIDNQSFLNNETIEVLKNSIKPKMKNEKSDENMNNIVFESLKNELILKDKVIEDLKQRIKNLESQIDKKDVQIENLSQNLSNQQILTLKSIQKFENELLTAQQTIEMQKQDINVHKEKTSEKRRFWGLFK